MKKYLFSLLLSVSLLPAYAQHDHEVPPTIGFTITGAVKREVAFSISNLTGLRQDTLGDIVIRNKRGEEKEVVKRLKGILLKTFLDSANITADKPKDYSELAIILTASDGYKNVYSWNELYNTDIGNHVYVITEMDGKPISRIPGSILVLSLSDLNSGRRHLKGLSKIEVKKI